MKRNLIPYVFLLAIFSFVTMGTVAAKTVVVNDVVSLILSMSQLDNGDTLKITSGNYELTTDDAPNGLILTFSDWTPYKDLTVLGEGMDATILDFTDNYGIFAYFSENLLIKNLTIKNARKNGGLYVQDGHVNLENVRIDNCKSETIDNKEIANGGAVFYDEASSFSTILNCVFSNNSAEDNGGAIAYMNSTKLYPQVSYIEGCQFCNNSSSTGGSALYLRYLYSHIYVNNNAFYQNVDVPAIYANAPTTGYARLYLKNNTIALNANGGMSVGSGLRTYLYLNNNAIVDNGDFDISRQTTATKYTGNYNVARNIGADSFWGYFNEVLTDSSLLFRVENDSLKYTMAAADYLVGRVPANSKFDFDIYGDTCIAPSEIGAINFPLGGDVAVWTGELDNDFFNAANWKNGLQPIGNATPSSVKKVIISDCDLLNFPTISSSISLSNGGDLSETNIKITPTGILTNSGFVSVDTLWVESQNGGTGQFLDNGTVNKNKHITETYFVAGTWTPTYISEAMKSVGDLFYDNTFATDYEVKEFSEVELGLTPVLESDIFDTNKGYWVKSVNSQKATFDGPDDVVETFSLQHTQQADTLKSGWNLIANPYGVAVETEKLLANVGNSISAAGAVYTYNNSHFNVWVDGIGDEEASVIDPHEGFYVQALDSDKESVIDYVDFALSKDNIVLIPNEVLKSTEIEREGLLTIGLATNSNVIYDKTYLRFKSDASVSFDYSYDAKKLNRLEGLYSATIYTRTEEGASINYAVNAQAKDAESVNSIPVMIDFVPSTITKSQNQKIRFFISGGDSISYLLHDALQDSSESVEVTNNKIVSFATGTDAGALLNRFSLEIFDGAIPHRLLDASEQLVLDTLPRITKEPDTLTVSDTVTFLLGEDSIYLNTDTIIALEYRVDSIYVDSFFVNVTYTDSIFYDSTFVDSTWLWGTYEYVALDTIAASSFERYTSYLGHDTTSGVYYNDYIVYDTIVVTGLDFVGESSEISVYGVEGGIRIESHSHSNMEVRVFDMAGIAVANVNLPVGECDIDIRERGVYIVQVLCQDRLTSKKVTVFY